MNVKEDCCFVFAHQFRVNRLTVHVHNQSSGRSIIMISEHASTANLQSTLQEWLIKYGLITAGNHNMQALPMAFYPCASHQRN